MHLKNGPWATQGGYEDNLVLIAGLLALADGDPKELSLDRALSLSLTGSQWALAALGVGTAASTVAIEMGRRSSARMAASSPPSAVPDVAGDPAPQRPDRDAEGRRRTFAGDRGWRRDPAGSSALRRVTGSRRPRYSTRSMPG